jgi:hypothetical protein
VAILNSRQLSKRKERTDAHIRKLESQCIKFSKPLVTPERRRTGAKAVVHGRVYFSLLILISFPPAARAQSVTPSLISPRTVAHRGDRRHRIRLV